jgi:hypothetical protein
MCLIIWAKDDSFEKEEMRKYMERRPQTTIQGRLVFLFLGRDKPPITNDEKPPVQHRNPRPVYRRPDSLTLAKYASIQRHLNGQASKFKSVD